MSDRLLFFFPEIVGLPYKNVNAVRRLLHHQNQEIHQGDVQQLLKPGGSVLVDICDRDSVYPPIDDDLLPEPLQNDQQQRRVV
jgi:hypothetical protein